MGLLLREEIGVRIRNKREKSIIHRKVLHGPIMIICHRLGYNKLNSLYLRNNKSKRVREREKVPVPSWFVGKNGKWEGMCLGKKDLKHFPTFQKNIYNFSVLQACYRASWDQSSWERDARQDKASLWWLGDTVSVWIIEARAKVNCEWK